MSQNALQPLGEGTKRSEAITGMNNFKIHSGCKTSGPEDEIKSSLK